MSAPVSLDAVRLQPCADVVDTLREALEKAESGEMRSVAIACEMTGQTTSTAFAWGDGDRAHMVYALERMKQRILLED